MHAYLYAYIYVGMYNTSSQLNFRGTIKDPRKSSHSPKEIPTNTNTHTLPTCTSPNRATLVTIDSGTKRERSAKSRRLLILIASFLNSSCVSDCSFTFNVCTSPSAAVYLERERERERERKRERERQRGRGIE